MKALKLFVFGNSTFGALIISSWMSVLGVSEAANIADNYTGAAAATLLNTTYWSLSAYPLVGNDAVFTTSSGTGIHALSAAALTVGSFDVTAASGSFTINNQTTTSTSSTLTLGGSGDNGNGVSGTAADLLYVASGATFNINGPNGSTGSGVLNVALGQSGNVNAAGAMSISAAINGSSFGITKTGSGSLTLSGANTFSGASTLSAGTLQLQNSTALPSVGLTMASGTTLQLRANSAAAFSPSSYVFSGSGTVTYNFDVNNVTSGTGNTLILANVATQFGPASTTDTFNLTGGNNYTLQIGSGSAGTGGLNIWNNTTINSSTAGVTWSFPGGINVNYAANYSLTLGGAGNLTLGALTRNSTYNLTPTFGGSGTITLNGANNFGAATATVSSTGTLALNNVNALSGVSTLTISGAATLDNILGSTIILSGNPVQNWNSDFTFGSANTTGGLNLGTGTVTLGATRTVTLASSTYGLTVGGIISGSGFGLTKAGAGTLTLAGANTYSGATTINNGKLVGVAGGSSASSAVTVNNTVGCVLGVLVTDNTKQWTCSSLTSAGTSAGLEFAFAVAPSATLAPLNITGNLTFTGTPGITLDAANLVAGTYPLIVVGGTAPIGVPVVTIANGGRGLTATAAWGGTGNKTLSVTVSGSSTEPLTWNSSGTGTWDVNNSGNTIWKDNASASTYYRESVLGDKIQFTDTGISANTTVTLSSGVNPAGVTVNNSTYNYTISGSGSIAGNASLTKSGTAALTLATTNTFSGGTTISAGTLKIGVPNALPGNTFAGDVSVNGTLDLNAFSDSINGLNGSGTVDTLAGGTPALTLGANGDSGSFSGIIKNTAGTLSLTKSGSGTQTLGGANTYGGATTVNAGTLQMGVANALPTATALTLNGTATLDLNSYNTSVANIPTSVSTATITDNSGSAGTTTFTLNNQSSTDNALVKDGTTRVVAVNVANANAASPPFALTSQNTFSGGLTLMNNASGTRFNVTSAVTTTGSAGSISSSPFGRGTITIGQAATDKAQLFLSLVANNMIANAITVNTAVGTDIPGGFRIDTTGNTLSGAINANLADAKFVAAGGNGSVTLSNVVSGSFGVNIAPQSGKTMGVTLSNPNTTPNSYAGATTIGASGTLTLGNSDQIPNGTGKGDVSLSGTLNLNGFNETINGLTGAGTVDGVSGSPVFTIGDNNANGNTFSGVIKNTAGNLNLVKLGSGTQTLSGANTFSGGLTVNNGTISFASDGNTTGTGYPLGVYPASANATAVTLNGGGLLDTTSATISANRGITLGASGGTLDASTNQTLTVNSVVTGTGGLTKGANTGTVILAPSSGNNNYGGLTTISGGKLVVQSSQSGTGNITVADGADLTVNVSGTSQLPPNTLSLGTTAGATLEFNGISSTTIAPVNAVTISSGGTLTVKVNSGTFSAGQTYPLIAWTTGSAPTANLSSMLALGISAHLVSSSTSLSLVIDSISDIWTGGTSGNWDTTATGNWTGHATIYADGDAVLFDDTATGTTSVTVNQVVQPSGIVVNNSSKNYTITSAANKLIGGTTSLTKTGSGTLTLSGGANTNTGTMAINGGTVSVSTLANGGSASDLGASANSAGNLTINGATLQYTGAATGSDRLFTIGTSGATLDASGSGALNFNNTGSAGLNGSGARILTLTGTNAAANTLAASIGDNGGATSLTKSGAGAWTLSGANTYSGVTTLSAGTLALSGSGTLGNGTSALTISGGTLNLGTLSLSVGAVSLTGAATLTNGTLTGTGYSDAHASGTATISAGLAGSTGLTVTGGGTLLLSGNNTFTGPLVVSSGTVNLLNNQSGITGGFLVSTNNTYGCALNIGNAAQTAPTTALIASGAMVQVGNAIPGGTGYSTINVYGASGVATIVTNNGTLWCGRDSGFTLNASANWVQAGDMTIEQQGGYAANFTVSAGSTFIYTGVNPINATVGGSANDSLSISGTFTTGQGINFNNLGTAYPVIALNAGGTLALAANIPLLVTNTGTGTVGQLLLGTGGGVFNMAGFSTALGLGIANVSGQTGSLTKNGLGTLTLAGTNTYTGPTTNNADTLALVGNASLASSSLVINAGAVTLSGASSLTASAIKVAAGAVFDVSGLASAFTLGSSQTLSDTSPTAVLAGNLGSASGTLALKFVAGTPAFIITNGTLTLSASTVVTITNTGAALAPGSYKIIAKATTGNAGAVAGSLPTSVILTGGQPAAGTPTLSFVNGELYLNVGGSPVWNYTGSTFTYDGTAKTPGISLSGSTGATTTNFLGVGLTSYGPSTFAPTNAGTYLVTNTVATDTNYNAAVGGLAFTINPATPVILLTSSANPAGYLDALTFVATNFPANATNNVVFSANGVAFSTNILAAGGVTSPSFANLPRGTTNSITAFYTGDNNYYPVMTNLIQVVTNHPPVIINNTYARGSVAGWRIAVSDLLTNANDIDGDTLTLISVAGSTNGIGLVVSGNVVQYFNTNLVNDQFTYYVTDGYGATNSGVINLTASSGSLFGQGNPTVDTSGGTPTLTFAGIPNYSYSILRSTNVNFIPYDLIWTTNAPGNGLFKFTDNTAPPSAAFYQLQFNP